MRHVKKLIHEEIRLWSKHYLEVRNKHLNGLPACPFARKSWAQNKVDIQIRNTDQGYTRDLHKHVKKLDFDKKELLIFCDVNYKQYSLNKFQSIIDNFNGRYNKKDVYFMGFHPYNPPNKEEQEFLLDPTGNMSDLPESKIEFSMMLIQKFSQLYEASDRLHRMGYYDEWPTDYYHEVVSSRQQQFKKLFKGEKYAGQKEKR
jgi:hypothetical protein